MQEELKNAVEQEDILSIIELTRDGAELNPPDSQPPLHFAAQEESWTAFFVLIILGADTSLVYNNQTALEVNNPEFAQEMAGYAETASALLNKLPDTSTSQYIEAFIQTQEQNTAVEIEEEASVTGASSCLCPDVHSAN